MRRGALSCLLTLALTVAASASVRADATTFPVRFAVATVGGAPVVSEAWLARQLDRANRVFAPAGVAFSLSRVDILEPREAGEDREAEEGRWPADLRTRADRHRLGPQVEPTLINVFVVRSLADVDVEGREISGVHWRSRRGGRSHYCILAARAGEYVLAHELGHFFGNPHSPTPGNIMSYEAGEGPPTFDARQLRRIRVTARRLLEGRGPYPPLATLSGT